MAMIITSAMVPNRKTFHAYTKSGSYCHLINIHIYGTWKIKYSQVIFEEIPLRVSRVDAPPVVNEDVEDAQKSDKETGTPLGLEADGDHDTGAQTNDGDDDTGERPVPLENKTDEEEDEENSARELEAVDTLMTLSGSNINKTYYLRRSVSLREGKPAKSFLFFCKESERTMRRPPTTLRLRRKKERSKRRP